MGSVVVPRGGGPVLPLSPPDPDGPDGGLPDLPDLLDLPVTAALTGTAPLRDVLDRTHTDAFLVLHDGDLVCEHYATPDAAGTPHPLASVTKSVVGCLAGRLLAAGTLDADAPVVSYLPELAGGGYAPATVRDLLDMRTGGNHRERHEGPDGAPDDELAALAAAAADGGSVRRWLATVPRVARTAGPFSYRSADTEVLGRVLEAVTGRTLPDLVAADLLGPLGAEADGVWETDGAGEVFASGGLALRPRDVARFGQMLLDGGAVGDRELVPARFLRDTYVGRPDSVAAFHARLVGEPAAADGAPFGQDAATAPKSLYCNHFWVLEQGRRVLLALGVHGQVVLVDGDNRVVAVKLSGWPRPQDPLLFDAGTACLVAVAESLGGAAAGHVSLHR